MFESIPFILNSEELIDKAISKSKKKKIIDRHPLYKKKKTIISRTESFSSILIDTLHNYVHSFPSIDELPMFYQELLQIYIDNDTLKKSLGAVNWAETTCQRIFNSQFKSLKKSKNLDFLKQKQKEIYGRLSSVVRQVSKNIDVLIETQNVLKQLPTVEDIPTIVLAGYPNVGKSSLLRCMSRAKPKIAQYPFTTKEIHVGHMEEKERYNIKRFQIIDTPGLLDRPKEKRNEIENVAIAALTHLSDVIIFLIDATETCGYSLSDQEKLLEIIKSQFENTPIIVIEGKSDVEKKSTDNIKVSCKTKDGIDELKELLFQKYYPKE